ncbi:MAG: hypothetical protein MJE68_17075, partial [Proteobacteria bacterium]|nr:hypothetical protein [Pseudomonadota bacterium]
FTIDEATLRAIMHPTSTGEVPIIPIYVYVASKFVHTYGKSATRGVASELPVTITLNPDTQENYYVPTTTTTITINPYYQENYHVNANNL